MKGFKDTVSTAWSLYRDGFRNMTWGRPLIWLILLKVFILFAVLRLFFFKPAMAGLSDEERSRVVGERIVGGASDAPDAAAGSATQPETYNL